MPDGGPWSMVGEQPPKPGGTFFYHETTNGSLHIMLQWIVCAFHGVSPRGRWSCVLPRWQINLNVLLWKNGTATLGNDISRIRTAKFLEVSQAKFAFRHRGHRTGAHTQMQIQHRSRAPVDHALDPLTTAVQYSIVRASPLLSKRYTCGRVRDNVMTWFRDLD